MIRVLQIILFVISIRALSYGKQTHVVYRKLSGSGGSMQCAVKAISNSFSGVKIQDGSNQCEPLPLSWNDSLSINYTYFEKTETAVLFEDDWMSSLIPYYPDKTDHFYWTLPGKFKVRARIEIHFQIPTDQYWELYYCLGSYEDGCHVQMYLGVDRGIEVRTFLYDMEIGQQDFLTGVNYIAAFKAMEPAFVVTLSGGETTHGHYFELEDDFPLTDIIQIFSTSYHSLKKIYYVNK